MENDQVYSAGIIKARKILNVDESADGEALRAAYIYGINSASLDIKRIEALNCSLEILIDDGYKHRSHFDTFYSRVSADGRTEATRESPKKFDYNCWNPFTTEFHSFEFSFLRRPERLLHETMQYYYLPFSCLKKLVFMHKHGYSINENAAQLYETNSLCLPSFTNEVVLLDLVRTSYSGRSKNIDMMESGTVLNWRITKESERYPYSIELTTSDGLSVGEVPNAFSACLTPLLSNGKIGIEATVDSVTTRRSRGKRARCSFLRAAIKITTLVEVPYECYFGCF